MSHPSDPRLLVLHSLRLKGFADTAVVSSAANLPLHEVEAHLVDLSSVELVERREGRLTGWLLTPQGRAANQQMLATELDAVGARSKVEHAYEGFLGLNGELLALCTQWQVRGEGVNDHSDDAYDQGVLTRFVAFHDRARPLCVDLREALARFGGYGSRLRSSLERVLAGEHDWLTRPLIDSYHTVWFELHEDLLATLGIDRADEVRKG